MDRGRGGGEGQGEGETRRGRGEAGISSSIWKRRGRERKMRKIRAVDRSEMRIKIKKEKNNT